MHRLISWYPLNRNRKHKGSDAQRMQPLVDKHNAHLVVSAFCWHGDGKTKGAAVDKKQARRTAGATVKQRDLF